jgi:hypothetical protein
MPTNKKFNLVLLIGRYIESVILLGFFGFFFWVVTKFDNLCVTGDCAAQTFSMFGLDNSLYGLTLGIVIPLFSVIGIIRIIINIAINRTSKIRPAGFVVGLMLVILSHFIFSIYAKDFVYIYNTKDIVNESPIITTQIFVILAAVILSFGNKAIWDQSSFFVKSRLVFYFVNLLILLLNINIGILFFVAAIPGLAITDILRAPHVRL